MIEITPNGTQVANTNLSLIEGNNPPNTLTRLGVAKVEFLIKNVGQFSPQAKALEIFGGTNLSTVILQRYLAKNNRLISVDLHYGHGWRYLVKENYRQLASSFGLKNVTPLFVAANATNLPFAPDSFGLVVAPDPPRSQRFEGGTAGIEAGLTKIEQENLFKFTSAEAWRVLKYGGRFITTVPRSWLAFVPPAFDTKIIIAPSKKLSFRDEGDPVVYLRCIK